MKIGNHLIVDLLLKPEIFKTILTKKFFYHFNEIVEQSLIQNKMNLLNKNIHFFDGPDGAFTALYLLSESHLSFHSWPEYNYIAIDIFTCGNCDTKNIIQDISTYLEAVKIVIKEVKRTVPS